MLAGPSSLFASRWALFAAFSASVRTGRPRPRFLILDAWVFVSGGITGDVIISPSRKEFSKFSKFIGVALLIIRDDSKFSSSRGAAMKYDEFIVDKWLIPSSAAKVDSEV